MSSEDSQRQQASSTEDQSLLQQISRNAYRVLGLPADASWRAISERASALHRAARAGITRPSPWNLDWYSPLHRDTNAISDALGRLSNPCQRLRERLFWIAQSETFARNIPVQGLVSSIDTLRGPYSSKNHHDVAVLRLISCFTTDPDVKDAERWDLMLGIWTNLATSETFWDGFPEVEESGGFEPDASSEDFDELRGGIFELIAEPIAQLARDAASRGNFKRCGRALEIIRGSEIPYEIVLRLASFFGPLRQFNLAHPK